jgi:hypothetical protein
VTVNYGLRFEMQGPMQDVKGLAASPDLTSMYGPSVKLFSPGQLSGNNNPTLQVGQIPYTTGHNFAPNLGVAWNPTRSTGLLGKALGGSKTVIRAYFGLIVYDEGTQFYAANIGPNAGKTISATTLIPGQTGQTNLPAFYTLSDVIANPLGQSSFAFSVSDYKKVINQADNTFNGQTISGMDPTLRAPYTENYNLSIERQLSSNTVLEMRYVGNQAHLSWRTSNLNEVDIFANGFLQEFKNAQNNLAINNAAGVSSFQNLNQPGQTALPIFDAAFGARGSLAAIVPASGYSSTTFIANLQNGEAGALANTLATNQNYVCRMFGSSFSPCARVQPTANAAGAYPINFFLLNPFVAGRLNFVDDTGWSNYNGLQVQLRQRFSRGTTWTTNYTWSKSLTNLARDTATQDLDWVTLRDIGQSRRVSPFDVRHVLQTFGSYALPVGKDQWLPINNRILDGVVGGWTLGNVFVFQTGTPIQLTGGSFQTVNTTTGISNGVRLATGVTVDQIRNLFNAARTPLTGRAGTTDQQRLAIDSKLVGPDGRANPQYLVSNTTPGDFGQVIFLRDRNTFNWNVSIAKNFNVLEKGRLNVFAGFNNVLNHPRWGFPDSNAFSQTFGVINGASSGSRTINLRATLSF